MSDELRWRQGASHLARLRDPVEEAFGRFGRWIYRRAWPVILAVALVVAALATQIPRIQLDTSTENLFPADDPLRVAYNDFRDRYGRDQSILLAVESEDVFDPLFLERLRELHEALEAELPHLDSVESLINARSTRGEADELIVEDLLEDWPESAADLERLRARVLGNPVYLDRLISRDQKLATIQVTPNVYSSVGVSDDALAGFDAGAGDELGSAGERQPFLTGNENMEIVLAVDAVVARHQAEGFRIYTAGVPVMVDRLMRVMAADMARFTGLALATIALVLAAVFRRLAAVVLPLVVSGLAMICALAMMAIFGIPLTTMTQIVPSFLLAVGVGGAVHIISIFYQAMKRGESKEDSIAFALQHSGLAVALTSFTTAGGLLSFISADISPMVELGIAAPAGIMLALLFALILLPALIAVAPLRRPSQLGDRSGEASISPTRRLLMGCGHFATIHSRLMILAWFFLLCLAGLGITRMTLSHDPISWFAKDDPMRVAMERIDEGLSGSMFVDMVIDTGVENGVQDPALLEDMEQMRHFVLGIAQGDVRVAKTISLTDIVKETHQALNENRAEFYVIPSERMLVAQELLLFENSGSDDLEKLVDSQFSEARLTMQMPFEDAVHYLPLFQRIEEGASEIFGERASVVLTGESIMMARVVDILTSNLIKTYILAFMIITPMMMLLLGSFRFGLVSMIPNLAPLVLTMGIMGWAGIPLEIFTLLIGSIALGLAVDDTVHFMHNFRRYYERSGDVAWAVRETLSTTGEALLFTSIVLSCGFFIYMFANMSNLVYFGLLTGLTIIFAFLADLLLAPAMMKELAPSLMPLRELAPEPSAPEEAAPA